MKMKNPDQFLAEKLAIKYCQQRDIEPHSRDCDISISAFVCGFNLAFKKLMQVDMKIDKRSPIVLQDCISRAISDLEKLTTT